MFEYYWFVVDCADPSDEGLPSTRHKRAVFSSLERTVIHSREGVFADLFPTDGEPPEEQERLIKFFDSLAGGRKWICAEMLYGTSANSPQYRKLLGNTVVARETPGAWDSTVVQWTREPGTALYHWYPFLGHESTWLAALPFPVNQADSMGTEGQPDLLAAVQALESETPAYFDSFELTAQAVGTKSAEFLCLTGSAEAIGRCIDAGSVAFGEQHVFECDWASVMQVFDGAWPF